MMKYNEPEMKIVKMTGEDVLTDSRLDQVQSGWETGSTQTGGGTVPFELPL